METPKVEKEKGGTVRKTLTGNQVLAAAFAMMVVAYTPPVLGYTIRTA